MYTNVTYYWHSGLNFLLPSSRSILLSLCRCQYIGMPITNIQICLLVWTSNIINSHKYCFLRKHLIKICLSCFQIIRIWKASDFLFFNWSINGCYSNKRSSSQPICHRLHSLPQTPHHLLYILIKSKLYIWPLKTLLMNRIIRS